MRKYGAVAGFVQPYVMDQLMQNHELNDSQQIT